MTTANAGSSHGYSRSLVFVSSNSTPIVIVLPVKARLLLVVVFIHKEKHVNVKLVAAELTVEVVPISRLSV